MKILFIRFSSIGDIILSTASLNSLYKEFPNAKIHFLTLEEYAPLLEGISCIDRIHLLDKSANVVRLNAVGEYLNNCNYNIVIDMHNSIRSKIILNKISSPNKYILKKPRWKRFKLFAFHSNSFSDDFSQIKLFHSVIDRILSRGQDSSTSLFVSKSEREFAKLKLLQNGYRGGKILVCVPEAGWHNKTWNPKYYFELFKSIKNNNFEIILLGTGKDNICGDILAHDPSIINLSGQTDFRQSLAIISQAKLVLGSDTGFVHAAEALGIPVAMFLGPTSVETGAGVNGKLSKNIQLSDVWCRPCSQNGSSPCYRSNRVCMDGLSPEMVKSEIEKYL